MRRQWILLIIVVGFLGWSGGGCGHSGPSKSSASKKAPKLVTVSPEELSEVELGPYFPPEDPEIPGLDNNRLKLAGPKGWQVGARAGNVLVWFKQFPQYDYPQILVTAEDFEPILNVTSDTASKFAQLLASELRKKNPQIQVLPIRVGDRYGAMYRRLGRGDFTATELESLTIETVVNGRKYAFELRTYPGHVEKYLHQFYAVFLVAKFLQGGGPSQEHPSAKPPLESPPE